ncbi:hypothetical protein [Paracoccus sp. (in: a-proteobacteria)]|uniref:hypothetical protein n=1 Tax=Paracoccus sp. TaxID=267 RepID=UPI0026DEC605|nr:hypothetical protein [Paracoccus sp. (in: a-proteobacteria)]
MAHHIDALRQAGVAALRLSPQSRDFVGVVRGYDDLLAGQTDAQTLTEHLRGSVPLGRLSDGFLTGASGAEFTPHVGR